MGGILVQWRGTEYERRPVSRPALSALPFSSLVSIQALRFRSTCLPYGISHRTVLEELFSTKRKHGDSRHNQLVCSRRVPSSHKNKPLQLLARSCLGRYLRTGAREPREASGIASKESVLRVHLIPPPRRHAAGCHHDRGHPTAEGTLASRSPKTVNNVLTVPNVDLKTAVDWGDQPDAVLDHFAEGTSALLMARMVPGDDSCLGRASFRKRGPTI